MTGIVRPMHFWGRLLSTMVAVMVMMAAHVPLSSAGGFDPKITWQTIRTPNFKINYPKPLEDVAQRAATIFEEVHATLSPELKWKPWPQTEVVLVDNTDESNGFTSVLPYNWIILFVVPPRADSSLANYDDWLKLLITHEYTHVLHLDAARGVWRPLRLLFGKLVAPAGIVPVWNKEGFAVYEETKHTTAGRGRSSYTEMMVRTSVLEGKFPTIDQADGLQWKWPTYETAYLFGVSFIQYLVDTYGEAKFLEFNWRIQKSLLLAMVNHQARRVYKKTFYQLWREWEAVLTEKYKREQERLGALTELHDVLSLQRDERYSVPALSPDGSKLIFTVDSPHAAPQIRLLDLASGATEIIRKKQGAIQIAWLPDHSGIIYATKGAYKRYNVYYDLWQYDFATKKSKRLTHGKRGRDPAVDPTGKWVLFVTGGVTNTLSLLEVQGNEITTLDVRLEKGVQFSRPQWSPDGKRIVVSVHTAAEGWKLYRMNADGSALARLTNTNGAERDPTWSPDGASVLFSSDVSGISNIYRVEVSSREIERLSNVTTGLFHPTTHDGRTIFVQHYTAAGFDLKSFNAESQRRWLLPPRLEPREGGTPSPGLTAGPPTPLAVEATSTSLENRSQREMPTDSLEQPPIYKSKKYVAFGKSLFLPRYLLPNVFFTGETTVFSASTGGADVLHWHAWDAGATYRLDAGHLGYYANYAYSRWWPTFGGGAIDYVVNYGRLTFDRDGDISTAGDRRTVTYFEERRGGYAVVTIPIQRHAFSTAFFYEDHFPKTSLDPLERAALNTGIFSGMRFVYAYADPEYYPASISFENGRRIRLLTSITNGAFGSGTRNEQVIFSGDWREYVRLWQHHTLGLRAAGGITWGDRLVQGTFGLGGALGEGTLSTGGSFFYFPLRGLPVSTFSRTRAMLFSTEYRIPFVSPQRGLGTTPFFIKNIHGALFADYGNAWNAHEGGSDSFTDFFDQFLLGVGAELRGDFILGHGLPLTGRLGYGIIVLNRDRVRNVDDDLLKTSISNGVLILQLGTSF